ALRPGALRHHRPRDGRVADLRPPRAPGRHRPVADGDADVGEPGADPRRPRRIAGRGRRRRRHRARARPRGDRGSAGDEVAVEEHALRRLDAAGRRRRDIRGRTARVPQHAGGGTDRVAVRARGVNCMTNARIEDVRKRALKDLQQADVMLEGHFDYGNGYHGRVYVNPHMLFRYPSTIWRLAQDLLDIMPFDLTEKVDAVVGPVTGGALLAHTLAGLLDGRRRIDRQPCLFAPLHFDPEEGLRLRPSYAAQLKGRHVLIADDVRNTGKTLVHCAELVRKAGGQVVATA